MGSSGEVNAKSIDPAVGGLVWVRRRNGSWWPGRIVGLDELTEDCLVSPRSGTPVKLLGRDDASVDWYNLERSKRVKTFRCGEYDDCIEKAKAAATANKKAVKYARREDAILHALELETSRQSNDLEELCSKMDNPASDEEASSYKASPTILNSVDESSDSLDASTSAHELSQSGISFEESLHGTRPKTPNDSEDDGTEGIKRMRVLEDIGLDKKAQVDVTEEVQMDKYIFVGAKENIPSLKRKRSQAAHVYDFLKRKSRRRKISKVLESTSNTLVSVPIMYEQHLRPGATFLHGVSDRQFSILECHKSKRTSSLDPSNVLRSQDKLKDNGISGMSSPPEVDSSDALFDVPFVEEDEKYSAGFSHIYASPSEKTKVGAPSRESNQGELLKNEGLHDPGLTTSSAAYNNINQKVERGTSKWQSKRKRNTRYTSKNIKYDLRNSVDLDNESNGDMTGLECIDGTPIGYDLHPRPDTDDTPNEHLRLSKNLSNREPDCKNLLDFSQFHQRSIPYQQSRFSVEAEYQKEDLYDIVLEVKSNYRPQHVPLVSLMSKLNGKAIIGHPLTVEAMGDGTSDQLVKDSWPALENGGLVYAVKSNTSALSSRKVKKTSLLLKKTRRLSALTSCQKLREAKKREPMVEKINGQAAITCIPLKVVFSRLFEAVRGSSRSSRRALTSS